MQDRVKLSILDSEKRVSVVPYTGGLGSFSVLSELICCVLYSPPQFTLIQEGGRSWRTHLNPSCPTQVLFLTVSSKVCMEQLCAHTLDTPARGRGPDVKVSMVICVMCKGKAVLCFQLEQGQAGSA